MHPIPRIPAALRALATAALALALFAHLAAPAGAGGASSRQVPGPGATPDQAYVGGLLSAGTCPHDSSLPPFDQFGELVVGNGGTARMTMTVNCAPYTLRGTTIVADADPAAGFPYVLRVTNIIEVRRPGSGVWSFLPCAVSVTRHEVAWPDAQVPRSGYRNHELLTTFPAVQNLCGGTWSASVHLRIHAAMDGGFDHRPPQIRVGNRQL